MKRRDFVKLTGLAGLSLVFPWASSSRARADEAAKWGGPFFLHMHALGGWDPTLLCDAKTSSGGTSPVYENRLVTAVQNVGGIVVPTATADGKFLLRANGQPVEDPAHFFTNVGKDVLVFNGVDTQTNNHDVGVQAMSCGRGDVELPAVAALFAGKAVEEKDVPMAFLAAGAYNRTGDVVGVSRFPGDKAGFIAEPFKGAPGEENPLIGDVAIQRIQALREERRKRLESQATLPRTKRTLAAFSEATRGGGTMSLIKDVVAQPQPSIDAFADGLAPDTRDYLATATQNGKSSVFVDLGYPLELALRCCWAGITVSATFAQGGFDTHANHDAAQTVALGTFLARLRYVLLRARQLGIADKLYVLVTSDFGRTPRYNTGNGKDHWNVTSAMLVGPGIRGGRAIGGTDEGQKALRVARGNVGQTVGGTDDAGVRLVPAQIHAELRRVLGVDAAPFIGQFPLPAGVESLPLLG